jgi:hypothetical protein
MASNFFGAPGTTVPPWISKFLRLKKPTAILILSSKAPVLSFALGAPKPGGGLATIETNLIIARTYL